MGSSQQPRPPLLAAGLAPLARAVRRAALGALSLPGPVQVCCPRCGNPCADWSPFNRQLYDRGGNRLGTSRQRVPVTCDRCHVTWQTSGRAVGRNRHNGRPLLG